MRIVLLTVLLALAATAASAEVKLPANTVIAVRATEPIDSKQFKAGQEVVMVVPTNITVNNQIVIKAGAPVIGFITDAKGSQMAGISGHISVTMRSTVAVDGQTIPLSGIMMNSGESEVGSTVAIGVILCPLALLNKGKAGRIEPGSEVRAMTVGEYMIDVDNPIDIQYLSTDYVKEGDEDKKKDDNLPDEF